MIILLGLGWQVSAPVQPLWTAHGKSVEKELVKWSEDYGKTEFVKTAESREFYRILNREGMAAGTLVLTTAPGRFDRFDLMVIIDPAGKISTIRILKYRSEYGSEISNKSWLSQFYNQPVSKFELHKNIDAISGATYSSRGLVEEINEVVKLFQTL
jgi:Na+-translocating ferredoxin:NAD+ oxidoreductase RnfG subunit